MVYTSVIRAVSTIYGAIPQKKNHDYKSDNAGIRQLTVSVVRSSRKNLEILLDH